MPAIASSRSSQKSYTIGRLSEEEIRSRAQEAVIQGVDDSPDLPAIQLAELLIVNSDPDLTAELGAMLMRGFYVTAILSARRKNASATRTQASLPGFEHLPSRIQTAKGKVSLLAANRDGVRAYYWSLMKAHSERRRNDPKIKEAKDLLDKMTKAARTEKGITVRQVLLLDT